jgi:hypothetical protein
VIPPREAVRVVPFNEQIPEVSDHDNDPDDCPPDAVSDNELPVVNAEELVTDKPVCDALLMVIVVFADDRSR